MTYKKNRHRTYFSNKKMQLELSCIKLLKYLSPSRFTCNHPRFSVNAKDTFYIIRKVPEESLLSRGISVE